MTDLGIKLVMCFDTMINNLIKLPIIPILWCKIK